MARVKGLKSKQKPRQDKNIEETYETIVEFDCPIRGRVKQKVKVKKLKSMATRFDKLISSQKNALSNIEESDDGLYMYDEKDE